MKYEFEQIPDRRNINSLKWDVLPGEIPLWVADMDFDTAPEIKKAIQKRVDIGAYGYAQTDSKWFSAYINWWKKRYNLYIKKDWIIYCTGIIPAVSSIIRKITTPCENIVMLTPVYNIFFNSILNNGRNALQCPLNYSDGRYTINFNSLEMLLSDKQSSVMLLCNPHNPVGRIWTVGELKRIVLLCQKYNVTLVSDEVHCDITAPGNKYTPVLSVSTRNCIMLASPSKSFNLAGLSTAAAIVPDEYLRHKVWRGLNTDECGEPNAFAVQAVVSAYNDAEKWFDEMIEYVWENRRFAESFIKQHIPLVNVIYSDATYLLWADVSATGMTGEEFAEFVKNKAGVVLCAGNIYGQGGDKFVRINLATSRNILNKALVAISEEVSKNLLL